MVMPAPVPDRTRALSALEGASRRFTDQLRDVRDPSRHAIGHWSIGEVGAHVSHIFGMYPGLVSGESSPLPDHLNMAPAWERMLQEDGERDPIATAKRIEAGTEEFLGAVEKADWSEPVKWHGGLSVPVSSLPPILTNECDVHGWDVAKAEGKPWTIPRADAIVIIEGHYPLLPHFVNEQVASGLEVSYELKVRGGRSAYLRVKDSRLTIDDAPVGPVDCHISADPVEYLLVGYGRKSQWGPMLTGRLVAWGRKPWLALKFARLFHSV
jgi:hypothetical protein